MYYKFKGMLCLLFLSLVSFGDIDLIINETAGIDRVNEIVHNGIPVDRNSGLNVSNLHIEDPSGKSIHAQFEVLSRWGGGLNSDKPIQWLLVTFPATVTANSSATYKIKQGSCTDTDVKLSVTEDVNTVTINTGVAEFKISKTTFNVFESASIKTNLITNNGSAQIEVEDVNTMIALPPEEVKIEHKGDLFTTVKVAGEFSNPAFAGIIWHYVARYSFYAGSRTAEVDFYYSMPGNKTGGNSYEAYDVSANAKVNNVKLILPLRSLNPVSAYVSAEKDKYIESVLKDGEKVFLEQKLRSRMTKPAEYEMILGESKDEGVFAEKPFVGVGNIGISIQKMKFYEPQSIEGTISQLDINIVADKQWLGPYMGAFAKFSVTLREMSESWKLPVSLDHRLVAWPSVKYVAKTGILDELWDGKSNQLATTYLDKVTQISENTLKGYVDFGMYGYMTYGVVPRYWYSPIFGNEFGKTSTWDGYFLGATFTDYHNAFSNVVRQFAQVNDPKLLRDLSFPAARRMLNTQIIQVCPRKSHTFAGWAPIGYGNYRQDNNSSHSYFENLYFYYYLTGDRRVIEVLFKAGDSRRHYYARKSDGTLVPPTEPPLNSWMGTTGRVSSQMAAIYWFLGHASNDASFLEDYLNMYQRLVARHTAFLKNGDKDYTFIAQSMASNAQSVTTDQHWMSGLYALQNMWWLYHEYGDITLQGVKISDFFAGVHNVYWKYLSTVNGNGTPGGEWASQLDVKWTGDKIGGVISGVSLSSTGENTLYTVSKACLLSVMFRSAYMIQDTALFKKAVSMATYIIGVSKTDNAWGKDAGLNWTRVHGAVGQMVRGLEGIDTTEPPPDTSDTCITDTITITDTVVIKDTVVIRDTIVVFDTVVIRDTILVDSCKDIGDSLYTPILKIQRDGKNIEIECTECSAMKVYIDPDAVGSDDSIRLRAELDQIIVYFKPWKFYILE